MPAQVLTQHNDNARTGANLAESILTPDAVATPGRFGKLFERQVEGQVYAQPLYIPNVTFPQGQRNAVYVATMRNHVYAFDADDPQASAPLWEKRPEDLGPFVPLPDPGIGPQAPPGQPPAYRDIADAVGIVSTPVISLEHNVVYVVALTKQGGQYQHRLHALDLAADRIEADQLVGRRGDPDRPRGRARDAALVAGNGPFRDDPVRARVDLPQDVVMVPDAPRSAVAEATARGLGELEGAEDPRLPYHRPRLPAADERYWQGGGGSSDGDRADAHEHDATTRASAALGLVGTVGGPSAKPCRHVE